MSRTPLHSSPIPFITLPNWVKAATVCGFNIQPIFDRLGIPTDLLHLEETTISAEQLGQVMQACVEASRSQHFPFVLGETFAFDYMPDIGMFLATSASLRSAMRVFEWVRELINPMIEFRVVERGERAFLELVADGGAATAQDRYFVESIFAAVAKFGRMLAGDIERVSRLHFRYAPPPYAEAYEIYFRAPVLFSQPMNALELPRESLDQPLEGAFPRLNEQAERRIGQQLAQLSPRTAVVAAVEGVLERQPQLLGQGIEAVADMLGMHPRTMQRRLQEQGVAYAGLLDRVRYRLALRALQDDAQDLETISEQLGFSDRRSFTRAFTRWAGVTPSAFRGRKS